MLYGRSAAARALPRQISQETPGMALYLVVYHIENEGNHEERRESVKTAIKEASTLTWNEFEGFFMIQAAATTEKLAKHIFSTSLFDPGVDTILLFNMKSKVIKKMGLVTDEQRVLMLRKLWT